MLAGAEKWMDGPYNQEDRGEREHDGGAGRQVNGPRQVDAEETGQRADEGGKPHHGHKMRAKQACRRGRSDEQREDQDIADGAHGNDHCGRDAQVQNDVQNKHRQAHCAGSFPVQARGVELGAKGYNDGDNYGAYAARDDNIGAGNAGE